MKRSRIAATVLGTGAIAAWLYAGGAKRVPQPAPHPAIAERSRPPTAVPARARSPKLEGTVTISGSVIDVATRAPIGNVEVVLRNPRGESTTVADAAGNYEIAVEQGTYRAFVRDAAVISVGDQDRARLPVGPRAEIADVPDEGLMPSFTATGDLEHVELAVVHAGSITGVVVDRDARPIARAIVRARGSIIRPALGSDVAETDAAGRFELRVPAGRYAIDASHPSFAGVMNDMVVEIDPGSKVETSVTLVAGCIITGRVARSDGTPGPDGAIERQFGDIDNVAGPSGRVEPDGTFRWATIANEHGETDLVTLRAWPWKSPPSEFRQFKCRDGARFDDVVFTLPNDRPTLEGTLVDAAGSPVPFTYFDVQPLDPGGAGQQERTDAEGHFAVFSMPAGRYQLEAQAIGRGILDTIVVVPHDDVRLQLGGTGRIAGTTRELVDGSFEVTFQSCEGMTNIAHEPRLVAVTGGRFVIDDAPACDLELSASWRGQSTSLKTSVRANDTAHIELAIGPPRHKLVRGNVTDPDGHPVGDALVRALTADGGDAVVTRTDSKGRYEIKTVSGAQLSVAGNRAAGDAIVGHANVSIEQVDIVVDRD